MKNTYRPFTVLLLSIILTGLIVVPLATPDTCSQVVYTPDTGGHHLSATTLRVVVRELNYLKAFDDDDFEFRVYYNETYQLSGANVTLFFANGTKYLSNTTLGDGRTVFYNIPVGNYTYTVRSSIAPSVIKTGWILSDGPEVSTSVQIGNLDRDNDDDDIRATVLDVENSPATGLNFSIHYKINNAKWGQTVLGSNGIASFDDIPIGVYVWKVTVMSGPYAGTVLKNATFIADGTLKKVNHIIGPFAGDPLYYDLEVFTYYETTLDPIAGVLVNVTYRNGTLISSKPTPVNGTVLFKDLPIAFINWTVTLNGSYIGLGKYYYDLTTLSADIRPPVVTSPGDQELLHGTSNMTITWQVYDEHPKELEVFVNSVSKLKTNWSVTSYTLVFNVTSYSVGTYTVKLKATDRNNRYTEDTIQLRIYENVTPVIYSPGNLTISIYETGRMLRWNLSDSYLNKYSVTRNGTLVANGSLNAVRPYVIVSLDGLSTGIHLYRLTVNDTSGNEAYDEVYVTVVPDTTSPVIVYEPGTVFYNKGERSVIRNWTVTEQFKSHYTIEVDGISVVESAWTNDRITFDFAGLAEGQHIVRLTVYDLSGNNATSSVLVIVGPPIAVLAATAGAGIVFLCIVIVVVWRTRFSAGPAA